MFGAAKYFQLQSAIMIFVIAILFLSCCIILTYLETEFRFTERKNNFYSEKKQEHILKLLQLYKKHYLLRHTHTHTPLKKPEINKIYFFKVIKGSFKM